MENTIAFNRIVRYYMLNTKEAVIDGEDKNVMIYINPHGINFNIKEISVRGNEKRLSTEYNNEEMVSNSYHKNSTAEAISETAHLFSILHDLKDEDKRFANLPRVSDKSGDSDSRLVRLELQLLTDINKFRESNPDLTEVEVNFVLVKMLKSNIEYNLTTQNRG